MDKFTTKQLQTALMPLRGKAGDASRAAYEMTFSEINPTELLGVSELLPAKTGRLFSIGRRNADAYKNYDYVRCVDCGTDYPDAMCNGKQTGGLCPWCRPDSAPWVNGRGL